MHLNLLDRKEEAKPQTSRSNKIIKINVEINEMQTKNIKNQ
jgi:hypothetical protein